MVVQDWGGLIGLAWAAQRNERLVAAFADKAVKIVWPMNDVAFDPDTLDEIWLQHFPNAEVIRVEEAGHFIQEDAHEQVIPELIDFVASTT